MTNHARLDGLLTKAVAGKLTHKESDEMKQLHREKMECLRLGIKWEVKHLPK